MAIFASVVPSSTKKMVKKGQKWSKITFFTTPTEVPPENGKKYPKSS